MPYVTSIEEVTREETREATRIETIAETKLEMASTMLEAGEPDVKILAYAKISREELAQLKERLGQEAR